MCRELGLLAAEIGGVHRARGELDRARQLETDLHVELKKIRDWLDSGDLAQVDIDAQTTAAMQATEPLDPAIRAALIAPTSKPSNA